ncbi:MULTISPECIES: rubrerythrin family protein [Methanohalophilus]|jgi:rubrerythrin|uniref:Rubrerythrin n=1 Tax=Methanohalophilus euhalobius TaxID=51203 RepID=A0A315B9A4_9EURY|nr:MULTISPECIES: rubrerythrin family protein [Methanohalophilus]KXS46731.1 MAG: rubrerythrin [Methanohalophilus sp. T328-1]OBZ34334.1 MAG: rubrerythrin [Methanohalophilus sp. DAL1]PQV42749.1 rubrerythrin [Methanohalophilus euhalobius]RNI10565.1 rubrerythrin family protein [Methanohalophilus euhalobius]RXG34153.1 rubrerythrin [Methanohalophilus sp. WG1-DM]
MSTLENLEGAFAGESMANRKYLAFAKKADEEGYSQIAKLFRAAAAAETIHAHNHLGIMNGIKSTEENLREAIEGETYEFEEMYPEFITQAKEEGNGKAVWSFDVANQVEAIHAELYKKALDNAGNNEEVAYYVCEVCGNTVENGAPDVCPICGAPASKFKKID